MSMGLKYKQMLHISFRLVLAFLQVVVQMW